MIDPNKRDLLYCQGRKMDEKRREERKKGGEDEKGKTLRYTANQRRAETGNRRRARRFEWRRRKDGINEIESQLPTYQTMDLAAFDRYLDARDAATPRLAAFYADPWYRRTRWYNYIGRQRSEQAFINRFKKTYGADAIVIMGDWGDGGHAMKWHAPTKNKGWLQVFKRNRIPCYLVNEYRTSRLCPKCEQPCERFKKRKSPRPPRRPKREQPREPSKERETPRKPPKERKVLVHGLLRCTNVACLQPGSPSGGVRRRLWNRDTLATCNMLAIVESMLNGDGRPERFRAAHHNCGAHHRGGCR